MMKTRLLNVLFLLFFITTLSGCGILQDIFAAGAWTGIIAALIVIGIIALIVKAVKR